jgi:hypothetical protein
MRRLSILVVIAMVLALAALAPATADNPKCADDLAHPSCKKTTPTTSPTTPPIVECDFEAGVLKNWSGTGGLRCQWTVTVQERLKPFTFKLAAVSPKTVRVNLPDLQVTDVYPSGGEICFREHSVGWNDLESVDGNDQAYSWTSFTLPATGDCGDWRTVYHDKDVFAISISVNRVRNGEVALEYTQP